MKETPGPTCPRSIWEHTGSTGVSMVVIICFLLFYQPACISPDLNDETPFTFVVLDVGHGLSQLGIVDDTAIMWDCGLAEESGSWQEGYRSAGNPHLSAIVISHADRDHYGGLAALPPETGFNGQVIVSVFEDTSLIRAQSGVWAEKLRFRTIGQGDTLGGLEGVEIRCIWPPEHLTSGTGKLSKNARSLCFMVRHDSSTVLISSDIDSAACRSLAESYGYQLYTDVLIVPHHGSAGSVDRLFYGYAAPALAVISSEALPNRYGHPSERALDMLVERGARVYLTYDHGHVVLRSNGYYWTVN